MVVASRTLGHHPPCLDVRHIPLGAIRKNEAFDATGCIPATEVVLDPHAVIGAGNLENQALVVVATHNQIVGRYTVAEHQRIAVAVGPVDVVNGQLAIAELEHITVVTLAAVSVVVAAQTIDDFGAIRA